MIASFSLIIAFLITLPIHLFLIFQKVIASEEVWAWLMIKNNFRDIWYGSMSDTNPPFYFLFLRAISLLFGVSFNIIFLRLLSLFLGILASVAIGYLGYSLLGKRVGTIAFFLSLFSPASIRQAVFARYYSFLILLTALAIIIFIHFIRTQDSKSLGFLTGILIIGVYTHYYFFLLLLSFGLYLILRRKDWKLIKKWLYSLALVAIFFLPCFYYLLLLPKPQALPVAKTLLRIPGAVIVNLTSFETLLYVQHHPHPLAYVIFLGCLLLVLVGLLVLGLKNWPNDLWVLFLLIISLPPTVAFFATYVYRYSLSLNSLVIFSPAFSITLAKGIDYDLKKKKVLSFVFLILVFISLIIFFQSSFWISTLVESFKFVGMEFQKGDIALHAHLYTFLPARYYLPEGVNFGVISTTHPPQIEKALGYEMISPERIWQHKGRVWYFEPEYYNVKAATDFKTQLDKNFVFLKQRKFKESIINVYLYENK